MLKKVLILIVFLVIFGSDFALAAEKQPVGLVVKGDDASYIFAAIMAQSHPTHYRWSSQGTTTIVVESRFGRDGSFEVHINDVGSYRNRPEPLMFEVHAIDSMRGRMDIGHTNGSRMNEQCITGHLGDVTVKTRQSREYRIEKLVRLLNSWQPPSQLFLQAMSSAEIDKWSIRVGRLCYLHSQSQNSEGNYPLVATFRVFKIEPTRNGQCRLYLELVGDDSKPVFDGIFSHRWLVFPRKE